ncbi:acyl-CoA--sterol O-acyltransferase 1 [Mangifera indica]|uniref:acyl-CoA--sterol O-acyltransferase 1 n=1 Tax=Mangifera indica TaxID=29780 RepID=UPI001CFA68F5|nr:acyl-CoA--sterol O-acyltransferase 1 [Mangifera indica]
MEGGEKEIKNFVKVWLSVALCLCYCYGIGKMVPKGSKRLVFVLPIVAFFLYLPLFLSSVHLLGITAFFIAWLANFKLLLFAFGFGPLCSDPSISLPLFTAVGCLPIKIQHSPPQNGHKKQTPSQKNPENGKKQGPLNYAIKALLLAGFVKAYDYSDLMHPKMVLLLYAFHIYFMLELILALSATMARTVLGLELEPQFNEPFLSTSLQDFWGKRWNLMVTSILRPTVYKPTLDFFTRVACRKWAPLPAVFATFVVSGLMHELQFFYLGLRRVKPNWEITWFFVLHGLCLMAEIALKKAVTGKFRLPSLISRPLTVVFMMFTGCWLFLPHFSRYEVDVRAFEEYAALGAYMKNVSQSIVSIL